MINIQNFGEFINEDNLMLRKLTSKSIIGFGAYKDLTVQDLINLQRESELLSIYYNLAKIDFSDEVKKELCIDEKRSIKKPGVDRSAFYFFKGEILHDIIQKKKEKGEHKPQIRHRDFQIAKKDKKMKDNRQDNIKHNIISSFGGGKRK